MTVMTEGGESYPIKRARTGLHVAPDSQGMMVLPTQAGREHRAAQYQLVLAMTLRGADGPHASAARETRPLRLLPTIV